MGLIVSNSLQWNLYVDHVIKVPMQRKFQSIANGMKVTFELVSFDVESFKGISYKEVRFFTVENSRFCLKC